MILAQKQTYGSVGQNREPRHKLTHLCQLIFDKGGKNIQWRITASSASGVGKAGHPQPHVNQ